MTGLRDDHPSCLTVESALRRHHTRPLYPSHQILDQRTGKIALTWPNDSNWPAEPEELAELNAAHLATPRANPFFVDTPQNVYAKATWEEKDFIPHDYNPTEQLVHFIQVVDGPRVADLMEAQVSMLWPHGFADEVLFAISLHRGSAHIARLLGCTEQLVRDWCVQATESVFCEQVLVKSGESLDEQREK